LARQRASAGAVPSETAGVRTAGHRAPSAQDADPEEFRLFEGEILNTGATNSSIGTSAGVAGLGHASRNTRIRRDRPMADGRLVFSLGFAFTMAGAPACGGGYSVAASDGSVGGPLPSTGFEHVPDVIATALTTSAARDIPCARQNISLVRWAYDGEICVIEGCGQRLTYTFAARPVDNGGIARLVLIGRVAIDGPGASR